MIRRPVVLALLSGLALGLGVAVLLQQFAVRPLDVASVVGFPALAAAVGAGAVLVAGRARSGP